MFQEPGVGFLLLLATAVTTALLWATVSLFTVIAGYIAQKADH